MPGGEGGFGEVFPVVSLAPERLGLSRTGIDYLLPIFNNAIGAEDMEAARQTLFHPGNLTQPYHSVNVDVNKRICFLE